MVLKRSNVTKTQRMLVMSKLDQSKPEKMFENICRELKIVLGRGPGTCSTKDEPSGDIKVIRTCRARIFYSLQDMFTKVVEEEEIAEEVFKDEKTIQEMAKSINLLKIMQANHRHVITVDQSTIISTSALTVMKM